MVRPRALELLDKLGQASDQELKEQSTPGNRDLATGGVNPYYAEPYPALKCI